MLMTCIHRVDACLHLHSCRESISRVSSTSLQKYRRLENPHCSIEHNSLADSTIRTVVSPCAISRSRCQTTVDQFVQTSVTFLGRSQPATSQCLHALPALAPLQRLGHATALSEISLERELEEVELAGGVQVRSSPVTRVFLYSSSLLML